MDDFAGWVGRSREQEDEITRPALRRIAAMLDLPDMEFPAGAALPPHWYAMFFPEIARQSELGEDGHPRRGDFLPPIPLPRRMFAGRRVRFHDTLRVGDVAIKRSTITAVTPKTGRSGAMVFVTIEHSFIVSGRVVLIEEQDVVYRDAPNPGTPATAPAPVPAVPDWSRQVQPTTKLIFRYSAITYNGHRIHYDADYTRGSEGYPGLVVNGGLSLLLLLQSAVFELGRTPTALAVRNLRPLFAADPVTLAGTGIVDGRAAAWVADAKGALAVSAELQF